MTLIISDLATVCPKCSRPIAGQPKETQTIEATSKKWKTIQLAGGVLAVLGFVSCLAVLGGTASPAEKQEYARNGWVLFFGGCGIWLLGRIGGWWYHG